MHWITHDRLSHMMRPSADPNVIYRVNRAMDNPDPWAMRLYQTRKNSGYYSQHAFDVPGLFINGHRAPNHNWMSAMMTGYMYGGKEGMYAAANHLMQDLMNDTLVRSLGTTGRDVFESMLNYHLVRRQRNRYLSSSSSSSSSSSFQQTAAFYQSCV
jgi:hypothetical protein